MDIVDINYYLSKDFSAVEYDKNKRGFTISTYNICL